MPSSEFAPLGGPPAAAGFRPLGGPAPAEDTRDHEADARAAAFEEGRAAGRAEAALEHARLASDLVSTLGAVRAWREELRSRYTPRLVALALAIARKVVGVELDTRPELWVDMTADAVRRLVDRDRVTVRASPRIAAILATHASELGAGEVRIVEDAGLEGDACRIESGTGDVDVGLAAQLAAVADALGVGAR